MNKQRKLMIVLSIIVFGIVELIGNQLSKNIINIMEKK